MTKNNDFTRFTAVEATPAPINGAAVGYFRYSAKRPGSGARQLELIKDYAERVFGRPIDSIFEDVDGPRHNEDRPGFAALKAEVQKGEISVIVVEDIARITRSPTGLAELEAFCENAAIKVHTTAGGPHDTRLNGCIGHGEAERPKSTEVAVGRSRSR